MQRVIIILGILGLALTGAPVETSAEVIVKTGLQGEYVSTVIVPGGSYLEPGIWSTRARSGLRRTGSVLNPYGDRLGDLSPTIAESNLPPHHPWAVWSRFNGSDYDLVWSSWSQAWQGISPLSRERIAGDDLNPAVGFTRDGRPVVAWWNRDSEDGSGTVYFSTYLVSEWLAPIAVSSSAHGGRFPSIDYGRRGQILVTYQSDDGTRTFTHQVMVAQPNTITDDIDPQNYVFVTDGTMSVKKKLYDPK